ncbi:cell envelope integrity protein TolA [Streptomyces sp. YPW6]|uniref:cell envelope integrity protein TolA n=1 Tax=Streptomyces sp. YPW6 TaxID=2840373 RepID=UPI003EBD2AD7
MAQVHASSAWHSADQARQSAIAAGKDAAEALKASTEAFSIAVTKKRQEEEARRKAAVEDKEKNEAGRRARELYRCGQGIIPCDPYKYTRWCMQSPVNCQILENGREIGAALEKSMEITKELAGLGQLEACLRDKDFTSCAVLVGEVLVGAKVKALKKAYDSLKLLKRGCKKAGKTTGLTRNTMAASPDLPCFNHDVPGLPKDVEKIRNSYGCEACAREILDSLGEGNMVTIEPGPTATDAILPKHHGIDAGWFDHVVVALDGKVHDAWTPTGGEPIAVHKSRWAKGDTINFGF